jgi:signal transduction histidine kinase
MKLEKDSLIISYNFFKLMSNHKLIIKTNYLFYGQTKLLFLFFLVSFSVFSQEKDFDNSIDSITFLLNQYKKTKQPHLPQKAFLLAEKIKGDSLLKRTYSSFAVKSFLNKDLANLSLSERKLQDFYIRTRDSSALAQQYYCKGLFFKVKLKQDSAFYYYNKSKNISTQLKDSLEVTKRLLSMAAIQYDERDYLGSEISIIEGLRFVEPLKEVFYTGFLYERLGNALHRSGRQKEARKKFLIFFELQKRSSLEKLELQKARGYANFADTKIKYQKARLYNHLADTYTSEGNYTRALEYYKKSLSTDSIMLNSIQRYEVALGGIAFNHLMLGNIKLAIKEYSEVLKSRQNRKYERGLVVTHSGLADAYTANNETKKAIFHSNIGLEKAKKMQYNFYILENLLLLSKLEKGEKGRLLLQEHFILSDSLFKRERSLKNQFANVQYEAEKKDRENASLKQENSKRELELVTEKQHKIIGWLIAGISILFIGFGGSLVLSRRKKMLFEAQLKQVEVRETERQQIAKSLHDEVAVDIRMLHLKLSKTNQLEDAKSLDIINENVRNLSHQISSESFNEVSFKDQIINLISEYFEVSFRIKVEEIDTIEWKTINNSIKRTLFLTIREIIQNAKKHAEASVLILSFKETKKSIVLIISDNGKGFEVSAKKNGIGLKNLKERIEEISGVFTVESEIEKGTKITIEISKNGK